MVIYLLDQFILILIIFITNLTNNFFQQVFESDHADCCTIFIQDKCNICCDIPHFQQKICSFLIFICIIGFSHDITYLEHTLIGHQKKILYINDTNNIIAVIFIDRNTCVHGFLEQSQQFVIACFHINGSHINSRNHDILGNRIAEIEHIVDQLLLFLFDDTIFMADIHIGLQLCFCHHGTFG